MKEFSIREGYWAISRNGILVLSRGGQNIARKTKRRERDVRKKRRGELRKLEIFKFISSRLHRGLC